MWFDQWNKPTIMINVCEGYWFPEANNTVAFQKKLSNTLLEVLFSEINLWKIPFMYKIIPTKNFSELCSYNYNWFQITLKYFLFLQQTNLILTSERTQVGTHNIWPHSKQTETQTHSFIRTVTHTGHSVDTQNPIYFCLLLLYKYKYIHAYTYIYIYTCTDTKIHLSTYIYIDVCVNIYAWVYICVCVYTCYIQIYLFTMTYR